MKHLLFVFLSVVFCLFKAQNNARIFSADGKSFKVFIADKPYNKSPQASVLLERIIKDTLYIKLEFENNQKQGATIYLLDKGKRTQNKEFNYKVEHHQSKLKVTYFGNHNIIPFPEPLIPKAPVVDTMLKFNNSLLGHFCELKNGKPIYFNNIPKSGNCSIPMNSDYINYINFLMTKAQVPDEKFVIAENTCENNCLSIEQLNEILAFIEYELDKLKLVKLAYFHIVDKTNEKKLDAAFRLDASKTELSSLLKKLSEEKRQLLFNCSDTAKEEEITGFVKTLASQANDAERFTVFKKTYSLWCYTVNQVQRILNTFTHDREKLDTAELLYFYCTEKTEYMKVNETFAYTTTAADLREFLKKQEK